MAVAPTLGGSLQAVYEIHCRDEGGTLGTHQWLSEQGGQYHGTQYDTGTA